MPVYDPGAPYLTALEANQGAFDALGRRRSGDRDPDAS